MKLINLRQIDGGQALLSQVNDLVSKLGDVNSRITALQNTVFPVKDSIDLTKLNLFYILADLNVPHSLLLNTCFYALWLISLCVLLLGYSSNNKGIYGIYLLLCALGANAVMLISPIFDVRSSVYTIYLFISLTIFLLNECTFNKVSQYTMIGLCSILCFMHVLDYIRLYHTIHLVNNKNHNI